MSFEVEVIPQKDPVLVSDLVLEIPKYLEESFRFTKSNSSLPKDSVLLLESCYILTTASGANISLDLRQTEDEMPPAEILEEFSIEKDTRAEIAEKWNKVGYSLCVMGYNYRVNHKPGLALAKALVLLTEGYAVVQQYFPINCEYGLINGKDFLSMNLE